MAKKAARNSTLVAVVNPCYNVYCEYRNNVPRGGVWSCTNRKGCLDCKTERAGEKGARDDG